MDAIEDGVKGKFSSIKLELTPKKNQEKPHKKTKAFPKFRKNAFYYFQSFSENASIDGLKFVGEEGRTLTERICWTIIIVIALFLSVVLVYQTFVKWINSPVIVTFATTQKPVYEIPFPAITICPEYKTDKDVFNFTAIYLKKDGNQNLTLNESLGYDALSLICAPDIDTVNFEAYEADEETLKFIYDVAPKLEDIIYMDSIEWKGDHLSAATAFSPVLTGEGVCYTFNGLDRSEIFTDDVNFPEGYFTSATNESEWTTETGYDVDADANAYPRRTFVAGIKGGLSIMMKGRMKDLDYVCGEALQGYKVALHHPAEIPRVKQNYFRVPINQEVVVGVKPNIMTTADELQSYTLEDRQCYFELEKKLEFFKIYNQRNCLIECLANYTLNSCGCVNFYMPRDNSTPVCGAAFLECTEEAKVLFLTGDTKRKIIKLRILKPVASNVPQKLDDVEVDFDDHCDCLPSCHSIDFDVETSQSEWNWRQYINVVKETTFWDDDLEQEFVVDDIYMSHIMIYFKDMQFTTSERNELYGYTDFWANVGGIIGLFTGFSFITMFEILYYLSLRLTCNIRLFGRRFWSGSPKVLNNSLCKSQNQED